MILKSLLRSLVFSILAAGVALVLALPVVAAEPAPSALEQALGRARVNGKYRMLLRQFKVEKDAESNGEFKDTGYRNQKEYAGQKDLPAGYWVYVKPYWYIWRDLTSVQRPKREWGPEQATGEPDTLDAGDIPTAWASASQDDQDEWLMLEYDQAVVPTAVDVYETYNPGALTRVTAFKLDGEEVEVWKGDDPTPVGSDKGVSQVPIKVNFKTNRIKIYLASKAVPGWNEIDAVGLHDQARTYWAVAADASSTYAQPFPDNLPVSPLVAPNANVQRLEQQVQALKRQIDELQMQIKKDKEERLQQEERVLRALEELKKLMQKDKDK